MKQIDSNEISKKINSSINDSKQKSIFIANNHSSFKKINHNCSITYDESLPITNHKEEIKNLLNEHQVIVIAGDTGSGKTTQIPKICLEMGRGINGFIGHTQPRRIAARSVAERIASELKVKLGNEVGFKVRFHDQTNPNSLIKLMTDGILLQEAHFDRNLLQYDTIIIDEAHERSLNIDFLLGIIKKILPKRPDLKVIITSATIDPQRFSKYFDNAPILQIEGRTFPVEIRYLSDISANKDVVDKQIDNIIVAIDSLNTEKIGDILIFLSGEREIHELAKELKYHAWHYPTEVLPLYSKLSLNEQNKVFYPAKGRKIVLATNVAETSLTVPGIKYVIDTGKARISRYNHRTQIQRLPIEAISKASVKQRSGRCGRTSPGICIRLYSEDDYNLREDFTPPEILRTNLAAIILQMLSLKLGDIRRFPFIDPPLDKYINDGYKLLEQIKAIEHNNCMKLTLLGKKLAKFPIDPKLGAITFAASKFGALEEILIIVSFLSVMDPRERPIQYKEKSDISHSRFNDKNSEFISIIKLWNYLQEKKEQLSRNKFKSLCKEEFFSYFKIIEWFDNHKQLKILAKENNLKFNQTKAEYSQIHKSLLTGFINNIGNLHEDNIYNGIKGKKFQIFPGSNLKNKKYKWIISGEIVETKKIYARMVAKIEPEWIVETVPHLLKYNYDEPFWSKKTGFVLANEKANIYGLQLYDNKKISFSKIDPQKAKEIFIQQALVERSLKDDYNFLLHNNNLIDEVLEMENKIRKRDILVDENDIFNFYNNIFPDHVNSVKSLKDWLKNNDEKQIFLTLEKLQKRNANEVTKELYPDNLTFNNKKYSLSYNFAPDNKCDGITITLNSGDILNLDDSYFEWLVPGILPEKLTQLIKTLPKSIRKNFVPAKDFAVAILPRIKPYKENLIPSIIRELAKITGIIISPLDFNKENIPDYLKFNFKVIDKTGKEFLSGKNLKLLQEQLQTKASKSLTKANNQVKISNNKYESWIFDDLEDNIKIEKDNLNITYYPAIVDHKDHIKIENFVKKTEALYNHKKGLCRLLLLVDRKKINYAKKNISNIKDMSLIYSEFGNSEYLVDQMLMKAAEIAYINQDVLIKSKDDFIKVYEKNNHKIIIILNNLSKIIKRILSNYKLVKDFISYNELILKNNIQTYNDLQQQLSLLVNKNFIFDLPFSIINRMEIYLEAMAIRLNKLKTKPELDKKIMLQIAKFSNPFYKNLSKLDLNDHIVIEYWQMLEEYKVALFAQTLKIQKTVSSKNLSKLWENIKAKFQNLDT